MAHTERHNWLDIGESEGEGSGYDSEAFEASRTARASKKRKLSPSTVPSDISRAGRSGGTIEKSDRSGLDDARNQGHALPDDLFDNEARGLGDDSIEILDSIAREQRPRDPASSRDLSRDTQSENNAQRKTRKIDLKAANASKTGVIYLSRVPPFMKPSAVKSLLTPYGEIGRIFLTPEDPTKHTLRVKSGGNKKRSFTDGWVEFMRKKDAKLVAETLNAQIVGGKKGGWYHDDVWNLKYLKGFKWHHLTEQIANENAERAARLRTEIAQTTKENKRFLANVEKAKMLEGIQAKKRKKSLADGDDPPSERGHDAGDQESQRSSTKKPVERHFAQSSVRGKSQKQHGSAEQPEEVQRVLSRIF